jgi:hypothetical protein
MSKEKERKQTKMKHKIKVNNNNNNNNNNNKMYKNFNNNTAVKCCGKLRTKFSMNSVQLQPTLH